MVELDVRVRARQPEADGICSFDLEPIGANELPAFRPGAHIDVQVAPGLIRQYSLCGHPQERRSWRIGVLREPQSRGGSAGLHDRVQVGAVLKVSAPRNLFELVEAPHSVLVAGGIGVTPILSMAQHLQETGRSFEMHYCARSPERMAFRGQIEAGPLAGHTRLYFSDAPSPQAFDAPALLRAAPEGAHLYVCGPAGFMDFVLSAARAAGWAEARLHREHFAGTVADSTADQAFQIRLQRSGATLDVPVGVSALQVLLDHGADVNYACEAGVCGSCLTRVLEGTPDHRDSCLMDAERAANDQFTPCCSRSKSPTLVLDL
ncbi:PDR/VanB family oxidoreductase [Hydrogenophaga sp. ANAO-22]|jgi:vanillate O-demethylase ferredoxin subunit|uniref:PDR/VanB family oxidoreductase n=1 Tax=Hydrogenophaga sp. ANAO-22 TaxID=3166645 RepID=UPI0036D2DFF6